MKIAIFAITEGGKALAFSIKKYFPQGQVYILPKLLKEGEEALPIEPDLKTLVGSLFYKTNYLIFIMATGIVVRSIAPYIQHKSCDPAVVVMDEKGKNIISLLSGHIGGANKLTLKLASIIGGNPVITTASDVLEKMAVDTLAEKLNCKIKDWKLVKEITAYLVNGGVAEVFSEIPISFCLPPCYKVVQNFQELSTTNYSIYIGNRLLEKKEKSLLQLYPKNLIIGIGCRKNTQTSLILSEVKEAFKKSNMNINGAKKIATIDLKADEKGIKETAKILEIPIEIISREEILKIEENFDISPFVKKTIGIGSVSEACAYLGSGGGKMILKKQKNQGVTVAIAREKGDNP